MRAMASGRQAWSACRRRARAHSDLEPIYSQARSWGRDAFLEALRDRRSWILASAAVQDLALQEVTRRLEPQGWEFLGAPTWQCPERRRLPDGFEFQIHSHRLGLFRHRASALEFSLIPGRSELCASHEAALGEPFEPFLIARWPVTHGCFDRVYAGRVDQGPSWDVPWLGRRWQLQEWLSALPGLRLPTANEWTASARAGSSSRFYWGDDFDERYLWQLESIAAAGRELGAQALSVHEGQRRWNSYGLTDMLGNTWEAVAEDDEAGGGCFANERLGFDDQSHEFWWPLGLFSRPDHRFLGFRLAASIPEEA